MALIKCNGCGSFVSDMASKCPKCGFPVEKVDYAKQPKMVVEQQSPRKSSGSKVANRVFIALFVISVLAFIVYVGYKTIQEMKKRENAEQEYYQQSQGYY